MPPILTRLAFTSGFAYLRLFFPLQGMSFVGRTRAVISLALVINFTACTSAKYVTLKENPDGRTRPDKILVVLKTGSMLDVFGPVVRSDTLHGYTDHARRDSTAIPVSAIKQATVSQGDSDRTAAAVTVSAIVIFVVVVTIGSVLLLASIFGTD